MGTGLWLVAHSKRVQGFRRNTEESQQSGICYIWEQEHNAAALETPFPPSVIPGVAFTQADLYAKGSRYSAILC